MREPALDDTDVERAILADALTEAGDVRGELMALDLRIRAATDDERSTLTLRAEGLRDEHRDVLLGELAPAVQSCTWDRGVLAEAVVDLDRVPDVVPDPRWALVRSVQITGGAPEAIASFVARLPVLETLAGRLPTAALSRLASGPALPIVRLDLARRSLRLDDLEDPTAHRILDGEGFDAVRELVLRDPVRQGYDPAALAETRVGRQLVDLDVPAPFVDLPLWVHGLRERLPTLARVRITELLGNTAWTVTRRLDGLHVAADVRLAILTVWRRSVKSDLAIAEVLDLLPLGSLASVEVTIGSSYRGTRATRERLEDSIDRVTAPPPT